MSAGAVFKLIANDGKADRMIMATELLNQRIKDIMCMRASQGFPDPTPTLVDLERTHILFVNAHFKPFAAIGYEYNKVKANTGNASWNGSVQYSIPQFGDFFSDMVINVTLQAVSATVGTVPAFPAFVGPDDQATSATVQTSALQGPPVAPATLGVYTLYTQQYVNSAGVVQSVGAAASNFIRYCEYPGERIFKQVKFEVNGNPLDNYTAEAMLFHEKFRIAPNKRTGWKRLVGQEVSVEAYSDLASVAGASSFPAGVANLLDVNGNAVVGGPVSAATTARVVTQVVNGPQTPQATQPILDLWVPLIFWFNRDARLAIASVSIPYGQRFITVDLETGQNIYFVAPGDLYLQLTVQQQSSNGTNAGLATAQGVFNVSSWVTLTPVLAAGSIVPPDTNLGQLSMDLYINNIFVNPEVHDIYIKRIGFSLIRVHRFQSNRESVSTDSVLLSQLKWPIEHMFVGLRPTINIDAVNNPNCYRDWDRLTLLTNQTLTQSAFSGGAVMTDDTVAFNAGGLKHKTFSTQQTSQNLTFANSTQTVDTIQLQAHGIDIFQQYKSQFFRDYLPYTFGAANINTPEDPGAYFLNFCLYPGTYQPSGHINISRAREFYLIFVSSYVTSNTPADLLVLAIAINFLLISDGSAVLRYST